MAYEVALTGGCVVSDDRARLDLGAVHRFISEESYWGRGRPRATMERAVEHSMAFGLYSPDGAQIGFTRVMSDRAMRAHLADVYVLPGWRGQGLGKALLAAVFAHPDLATVTTWTLNTDDAHALYAGFGFGALARPETFMIRVASSPTAKTS
jgi:GNAT superfamily N-acetyltransferase